VISLFDWKNKNSAVTNLAGPCGLDENADDVVDSIVVGNDPIMILGKSVTWYSTPRYTAACPLWRPVATNLDTINRWLREQAFRSLPCSFS